MIQVVLGVILVGVPAVLVVVVLRFAALRGRCHQDSAQRHLQQFHHHVGELAIVVVLGVPRTGVSILSMPLSCLQYGEIIVDEADKRHLASC